MAIGRAPHDLRRVYILDWGLCRKYMNDQGKVHRPRIRPAFRGTPRYASANALADIDQGRVDDMWSWIFTLIELTVGKLPWDDEAGPQDIVSLFYLFCFLTNFLVVCLFSDAMARMVGEEEAQMRR